MLRHPACEEAYAGGGHSLLNEDIPNLILISPFLSKLIFMDSWGMVTENNFEGILLSIGLSLIVAGGGSVPRRMLSRISYFSSM